MIKSLYILFVSFICVVVFNNLLRIALVKKEESIKKDKELGWDFSNYKERNFNDIGLRTELNSSDIMKLPNSKIIFLGNSVVAGDTFDHKKVFPNLINEKWQSKNLNLIALNAGYEGYEIYREVLKYRRDLTKLKARAVVWFPNTNDYQNKESIIRNFVQTEEAQGTRQSLKTFFIGGFDLLSGKIQYQKEVLTNHFLWSEKNDYYSAPLLNDLNENVEKSLVDEILAFDSKLKEDKTKLIVVFLPPRNFCLFNKWNEAKSFKRLNSVLSDMKIPTVTLFDKLPCKEKNIYFDYVHFNLEGHKVIAEKLSEELIPLL